MPRCASGAQCNSPQLPVVGADPFLHPCYACGYNIHSFCVDPNEEADDAGNTKHLCKMCAPAWHARASSTSHKHSIVARAAPAQGEGSEQEDEEKETHEGALAEDDDGEDYSGPHASVLPPERLQSPFLPHSNKSSRLWRLYHIFTKNMPDNIASSTAGHGCCNICGRCIKVQGGSTSLLKQHLRVYHKPHFEKLYTKTASDDEDDRLIIDDSGIDYSKKHESIQPPERLVSPFGPNSTKSSAFWRFYHLFAQDDVSFGSACCNICAKVIKICGGSTSSLQHHLRIHHKSQYGSLSAKKGYAPVVTAVTSASTLIPKQRGTYFKSLKPDKERAMNAVFRSIALWAIQNDQISFDIVEDEGFRNVLHQVHVQAKSITEADLAKNVSMQSYQVKQQMRAIANKLKGHMKVQLIGKTTIFTTNHVVLRDNESYASLTAHFVEDFKIRSLTLNVFLYKKDRAGAVDIGGRWSSWGLNLSQVPFTVSDTDSKSNKFSSLLDGISNTQHLQCIDYDLQEIASIAFQSRFFGDAQSGDDSDILRKARILSNILADSSKLTTTLQDAQVMNQSAGTQEDALPVLKDMVMKWWSTYNMVSRLIKLRQSISMLLSSGTLSSTKALSHKDWLILEDLETVLKPFAHAVKALQGAKYVTISLVPHILPKIRADLATLAHSSEGTLLNKEVIDCAAEMLHAFDRRYGNFEKPYNDRALPGNRQFSVGLHKAFYFALVLDPRFKTLAGTSISEDHKDKIWEGLENEMQNNELAFCAAKATSARKAAGETEEGKRDTPALTSSTPKRQRTNSDEGDYFLQHFGKLDEDDDDMQPINEDASNTVSMIDESIKIHDIKADCAREIAMYRQEKGLKFVDRETGEYNDPLGGWWKERHQACPILWRLAQIYLAIPATTDEMSSEASGNTSHGVNASSAVPPDLVEDMILVKLNMGKVNGLNLMEF